MSLLRRRLASDTVRYTGSLVASRIPAFLFLPVFASALTPEDMGLYLTALLLVDLIQSVSSLGMVQALFRFFPQAKGPEERRLMLGTALLTGAAGWAAACALVGGAFLWPGARASLEAFRGFSPDALLLILLSAGFINVISILTAYAWAEKRSRSYLAALVAGAALEAALSLAMVWAKGVRLERILAIECVRGALVAVALAWVARRDLSLRFSPAAFFPLFRFGIWLMPMGLFAWMLLSIDRFWLGQLAGLGEVGVYGFFYKFASPAAILFQSYIISLDSHLFKSEAAQARILVENSLARYLKGAGALLAGAALVFPAAVLAAARGWNVLPAAYLPGLKVYPLLLATTYVYFWSVHYASMLEFQLRSKRQLAYMSGAALGNFVLCPTFITLGSRIHLGPMESTALSNLAAATGLLLLQSSGSSLAPAWSLWRVFLPALGSLIALHFFWTRLG